MRGLSTLGVKNQQKKDGLGDGHETPLSEAEVHSFRSTAARANNLALDRPDLASRKQGIVPKDVGANESRKKRVSRYLLSGPAWCTSLRGNLARTWMSLWTRISRGVWPLGGAKRGACTSSKTGARRKRQ